MNEELDNFTKNLESKFKELKDSFGEISELCKQLKVLDDNSEISEVDLASDMEELENTLKTLRELNDAFKTS